MQALTPLEMVKARFQQNGQALSDRELVLRFLQQVDRKASGDQLNTESAPVAQQIKSKINIIQQFSRIFSTTNAKL